MFRVDHLVSYRSVVIKLTLFAFKQKSVVSHKTSKGGIPVYKFQKLKDETETVE